jgi:high-affinity iron transporter
MSRRAARIAAAVLVVVLAGAGVIVGVFHPWETPGGTTVVVTGTECGAGWRGGHSGQQTLEVRNESSVVEEVDLDDAAGAVVAQILTLAPSTTVAMTATLGPGDYSFVCMTGSITNSSLPVHVGGPALATPIAAEPVTLDELIGPNGLYQTYAAGQLSTLAGEVKELGLAIEANHLPAAKADWLQAQMTWERVGASYDSFGANGQAVDGLPDGLPGGVNDPDFTGLHRIEYGLYNGQSASELIPAVTQLQKDVAIVQSNLTSDDEAGDPTNLPLRAHEVLEDALRDHLSGIDDGGSGMAYALTYADSQVTQTVVGDLTALLNQQDPGLIPIVTAQLNTLQTALAATQVDGHWQSFNDVPLSARQRVDAATGALLANLSQIPGLLGVSQPGQPIS